MLPPPRTSQQRSGILLVITLTTGTLLAEERFRNYVEPPSIPPRVEALMDGSRQMMTAEPMHITRARQVADPYVVHITEVERGPIEFDSDGLRSQVVRWSSTFHEFAAEVIRTANIPDLDFHIFGEPVLVRLDSFQSTGLDSGILFGHLDEKPGSRVTITYGELQHESLEIVQAQHNDVKIQLGPGESYTIRELDSTANELVPCGVTDNERAQ